MKKLVLMTSALCLLGSTAAFADRADRVTTVQTTYGDTYYEPFRPVPYAYDQRWPSTAYYERWHHHNWHYWERQPAEGEGRYTARGDEHHYR